MLDVIQKLKQILEDNDKNAIDGAKKMASDVASIFPMHVHLIKAENERNNELERIRQNMIKIVNDSIDSIRRFTAVDDASDWNDILQQSVAVMTAKMTAQLSMEKYHEKQKKCKDELDQLEKRFTNQQD